MSNLDFPHQPTLEMERMNGGLQTKAAPSALHSRRPTRQFLAAIIPNESPIISNVSFWHFSSLIFGVNIFDVRTPSHFFIFNN